MSFVRIFLASLLAFLAHFAHAAGADGVVGMVLDLQGSGQVKDGANTGKLQLLAYLKPQMQVTLDAGSKASLTLYATRTVYQLTGPAVVEVGKDKLNVLQGKPPVTKSMQEKLVVAAENVNVTPGAVRMRGVAPKLETPMRNSVILTSNPSFSWIAPETSTYDVVVQDGEGQQIAAAKVTGTKWQLPANVKLGYGKSYTWTVSYSEPGSSPNPSSGGFSIAEKDLAQATALLKPAPNLSVEEWNLYAMTLYQRKMYTDARAAWQLVCARRPDLAAVCDLAKAVDYAE